MKRVTYFMGVIALFTFCGREAYACSCAGIPGAEIESLSRAEFSRRFISGSVAVFTGRVVEAGEAYQTKEGPYRVFTFEVETYWKGPGAAKAYIHTSVFGATCGVSYVVGNDYLVIAERIGGQLYASLCRHGLANRNREVFLRRLGKGKRPPR